jgi:hypothetical protein
MMSASLADQTFMLDRRLLRDLKSTDYQRFPHAFRFHGVAPRLLSYRGNPTCAALRPSIEVRNEPS